LLSEGQVLWTAVALGTRLVAREAFKFLGMVAEIADADGLAVRDPASAMPGASHSSTKVGIQEAGESLCVVTLVALAYGLSRGLNALAVLRARDPKAWPGRVVFDA